MKREFRLDESHVELDELLEEKKLEGIPLLVLANKQVRHSKII